MLGREQIAEPMFGNDGVELSFADAQPAGRVAFVVGDFGDVFDVLQGDTTARKKQFVHGPSVGKIAGYLHGKRFRYGHSTYTFFSSRVLSLGGRQVSFLIGGRSGAVMVQT
jgi:hypothetical protein